MATHSSILAWRIAMDRGAWWATVHGVSKSWTPQWLSTSTTQHKVMFLIRVWLLSLECVWTYRVDQTASAMGMGGCGKRLGMAKRQVWLLLRPQSGACCFAFLKERIALSLLLCHVLHPLLHVSVNLKVQDAQSDLTLCDLMDYTVHGMNPGLPHCRWILYQLSCKGSLRILGWVAYPSLANLPDPGIEPGPGGSEGKASAYNAGDLGSIPGSGRSPGEGSCNPLQCSCLENPMDREAW